MSASNIENLKNFEERLNRIEGAHRKAGRVSRKGSGEYFRKEEERRKRGRKGKRGNWTFRIMLVIAAFLGVKTYIIFDMGPEAYDTRMAELRAGDQYQKIAAMALQPDPVTGKLQELLIDTGVIEVQPVATPDAPAVLTAGVGGTAVESSGDAPAADAATPATDGSVGAPTNEEADTADAVPASQ